LALVPDETDMNRFVLYERNLESSIKSALRELHRHQAARAGHIIPAPAAIDVVVTGNTPLSPG
jgi:hypothetical protein